MIIASFDLATQTGVAVGEAQGDPSCWSERLGEQGGHQSERFAACMRLTDQIITDYEPGLISIEAPLTGIKEQSAVPLMLIGLRACVFGVARIRGIPVIEYQVKKIRVSFLGKGMGNLTSKEAKARVMQGCSMRGWRVEDDNAADAAALWDHTRAMMKFQSVTPLEAWGGNSKQA